MNHVTAAGVLKCRPFGGVGVLIDKSVCTGLRVISKADRYIIVQLDELWIVNVYLPCASTVNDGWKEDYLCTLAAISNDISAVDYKYFVFGGDLNVVCMIAFMIFLTNLIFLLPFLCSYQITLILIDSS